MKPQVVVVAGASLHGKTTLARKLAERLGYFHQEIDELRVKVFGYKNLLRPNPAFVDLTSLHTDRRERRAQDYMILGMIEGFLEVGEFLVVSGMFGEEKIRRRVRIVADRTHADVKMIHCVMPGVTREEIERRIASAPPFGTKFNVRQPVTWEQYLWARDQMQKFREPHLVLDTMQPLDKCVRAALAYIRS